MSTKLRMAVAGIELQNPVMLAAGTAAYGEELAGVMDLESLGAIVTKAVSREPRKGAPAPRVAEFPGGMINAVGLANPGMEEVALHHLPWLATHLQRCRVLVNVVGYTVEDFGAVVERLTEAPGKAGFELNVSCPNEKAGGLEFGADPAALSDLVRRSRAATKLPLFVKLSPTLPDIVRTAGVALEAGADGVTVVNTWPGLVIDLETRRPALGNGTGGVSGPGLLPIGVLATWRIWKAHGAPIVGAGGVTTASDLLQYVMAGASAVAIGTAALRNPRVPRRVISEIDAWCSRHDVQELSSIKGSLEWPT